LGVSAEKKGNLNVQRQRKGKALGGNHELQIDVKKLKEIHGTIDAK